MARPIREVPVLKGEGFLKRISFLFLALVLFAACNNGNPESRALGDSDSTAIAVVDNNPMAVPMTVEEIQVDSAKMKELLPYFDVKKDVFDPSGKVWYEPKSAPKYTNQNGIYLYFATQGGKIRPLRFRIQYYAEDWLFFKKVQFSIDGNAYEYVPSRTETDSGDGGMIWEWFDEALNGGDKELIYALTEAKSAKMKFVGQQYYDIKTITQKQVTNMKRTLELYRAMGGTLQ